MDENLSAKEMSDRLWLGISGVSLSMFKEAERQESLPGRNKLTLNQARALRTLFNNVRGSMMLKELAQVLRVTPGAASQQVAALVELGLVERQTNASDRRSVAICLSPKGYKALGKIQGAMQKHLSLITAGISRKELETCCRVLQVMCDNSRAFEEQRAGEHTLSSK
ncbi:MAG: MarR family transcriptional regulator [Victivallales bacterium]|nr:MarR family transcriptional regulator [Victivallales bacterium]